MTLNLTAEMAVAEILGASGHYEVLSAPREAGAADLRRAYLKASVLVHPDKNKHPDATRAFQRVAAAWAVLGTPEKRRRYDAQLLRDPFGGDFEPDDCDFDEGPQVSPEEAFAAFAFAVASGLAAGGVAAGGGGGAMGAAADAAETIFWAQQLGSLGQAQQLHEAFQRQRGWQQQQPQGQDPPFLAQLAASPELMQVAGGVALSAGVFAAGVVVSCLGLPRIGSTARRVALLQAVSHVAVAAQIPQVRERVEHAANSTKEGAQFLFVTIQDTGAAVGSNVRQAINERLGVDPFCCDPTGGSSCGSSSSKGRSKRRGYCIPWVMTGGRCAQEEEEELLDSQRLWFEPGSWVRLHELQKAVELEGRIGEVIGFDSVTNRYQVQLLLSLNSGAPSRHDGAKILIKEANLQSAIETAETPPMGTMDFI